MNRNKFGINSDEGIALTTVEEFELLYVDAQFQVKTKLLNWLKSGDTPLLFGGQIGCGKTTLLKYVFLESKIKPDITFNFDTGSLNISEIDSWSIVFTQLFGYIADNDLMDLHEIPDEYKEILGTTREAWFESIAQIRLEVFSESSLKKNKKFNNLLQSNQDHIALFFNSLIKKLNLVKGSNLILFASGIDKFETGTTSYFALREILILLSTCKTLFEVNAVHLFSGDSWMNKIDRLMILSSDTEDIKKMLNKRLGRYAKTYSKEIDLMAKFSGGIPRQGVRLLDSFLAVQKQKSNKAQAFFKAVENLNRDFFAFANHPEHQIMQSVYKDQYLETSLISLPGDKETAKRAVFGNWIILSEPKNESCWNAFINPLIKESFLDVEPKDPEQILLAEYADTTGISYFGLELDINQLGWQETLIDLLEKPIEINVTEILDSISSALLSKNRADRTIIAYEDIKVAHAVKNYLKAKSNTYEYQTWSHHEIKGDQDFSPLIKMRKIFNDEPVDIFSFEITGDISIEALDELNISRDIFINQQLIWWIPKNKLNKYLGRWTQLRQFFQVYILEEDLTRSLSIEDLESDLDFMREFADSKDLASSLYVKNLKSVLDYLKDIIDG